MSDYQVIALGYSAIALLIILVWVITGITAAGIYTGKGRSRLIGFVGGFLLGPLAILLTLITPTDHAVVAEREVQRKLASGEYVRCPHCDEVVSTGARVCPHCQRGLVVANPDELVFAFDSDVDLVEDAIALAKTGDRAGARLLVDDYLTRHPNDAQAWVVAAKLSAKREEAVACLQEVLRIDPGDAWASEQLDKLGRLP